MGEWKFKCERCRRIYKGSTQNDVLECICHMDCDYCGQLQTVTTPVTKSGLSCRYPHTPQIHEPDPWNTNYGPCSNCGHYQAKSAVYALPMEAEDVTATES